MKVKGSLGPKREEDPSQAPSPETSETVRTTDNLSVIASVTLFGSRSADTGAIQVGHTRGSPHQEVHKPPGACTEVALLKRATSLLVLAHPLRPDSTGAVGPPTPFRKAQSA